MSTKRNLIDWKENIYRPNYDEIIKSSSEAYYGKERGKSMEEVMYEEFHNEPEHKLLSFIPSWQKEFNQEEKNKFLRLINAKHHILKGFKECKMKREFQEELKNYLLRLEPYKKEARDNYHKYLLHLVMNEEPKFKKMYQKEADRDKKFNEFWESIFKNLDKEIIKVFF